MLCQVTSNPYGDPSAIALTGNSFSSGGLNRDSFARPGKLFTASASIVIRVPPGNRLEALKGNLAGLHSIRVNDQFRVCFRWAPEGPEDVEIVDYH